MHKIYLSLWDSYADQMLEHVQNKGVNSLTVVILQFGTLKYYGRFGYVNNSFNVSRLFIDDEIDEIISFKSRLIQNSVISTSAAESSMMSGKFLSLYDEYVVKSEFNNIAEINLNEVKSVVIVTTIKLIPVELPWFYDACKACNKKLIKKCDKDGSMLDQESDITCNTNDCKGTVIQTLQRLKIPLTVQDSTGSVSLTLFDREACKILKCTASALIEKHFAGGDTGLYPDEFCQLLDKKYAFKVDITDFNIDNNHWFFGINKLTDDAGIISELEKKANNLEVEKSDSITNTCNEIMSQETVNIRDVIEITDDNVTPLSENERSNGKRHVGAEANSKSKSVNHELKRKLVQTFDVDETGELSATKPRSVGKPPLLTQKIEK